MLVPLLKVGSTRETGVFELQTDAFVLETVRCPYRPVEEVRMVAALAQLHEHVVELHRLAARVLQGLVQDVLVHALLPLGERGEEDVLLLLRGGKRREGPR